ncbi:unnamed protein product [Orchesella dallaii]|uniref:Secreted protein n=1 Tax=Orchesella dallaii TaxID=48710 RepID=A0ABP1R2W0_9HEXA
MMKRLALLLAVPENAQSFPFLWPSFGKPSHSSTTTTTTSHSGSGPPHPHAHSPTPIGLGQQPHSSHLHVRPAISSYLTNRPLPPLVG